VHQLLLPAPKPILSVLQSLCSSSSLPRTGSPRGRQSSPDVPPWPGVPLAGEQQQALQEPAENSCSTCRMILLPKR
ncbi:unnamed protein product, partial [Coccothraustes coccothraustes]